MERLIRSPKEEVVGLREWASTQELEQALAVWVELYNTRYLHSTLGYRTPSDFELQQHPHPCTQPSPLD